MARRLLFGLSALPVIINGEAFTDETLREAVTAWCDDEDSARAVHGDITVWDVSKVKSMENLFSKFGGCATYATFDADISAWDGKRICISSRPAARKFSACLFLIFHRAVFLSHNFCNPNHP